MTYTCYHSRLIELGIKVKSNINNMIRLESEGVSTIVIGMGVLLDLAILQEGTFKELTLSKLQAISRQPSLPNGIDDVLLYEISQLTGKLSFEGCLEKFYSFVDTSRTIEVDEGNKILMKIRNFIGHGNIPTLLATGEGENYDITGKNLKKYQDYLVRSSLIENIDIQAGQAEEGEFPELEYFMKLFSSDKVIHFRELLKTLLNELDSVVTGQNNIQRLISALG